MDGLAASAGRRLGFGSGDEPGRKSATSEAWVHPEVLKLATVAPGPSAYAGYHRASVTDEYRQVHFVTQSHGGGRLTVDLRLNELDVQWIRSILDVEVHGEWGFRR